MSTPLFTEAELRDFLSRGEGQFLEFKSVRDRGSGAPTQVKRRAVRDLIAESVAAFANADGGLLLIGIEDDGSPTGHDYPDHVIREFVSVPQRRLRPPVSCRSDRLTIDGAEVLVFSVPIAPEAVMIDGNGFPYRVGASVIREPQEIINEEVPEYPDFAWQEAIVNAFAHRDYEFQGREVEVWFYGDRMEVSSRGAHYVPEPALNVGRKRAK